MAKKSTLYIITKSVWGGAAKYVYDLATHLPKDKFYVSVAAGSKDKFAQKIIQANLPYYQIQHFQRSINPLRDIFALFEALRLLFRLRPDIIHVNSSKAGGIVGLASWIYKILTSQPLDMIFTAHGWAFNEDRPSWQLGLIKLFSRLTALFYDKIICVSEYDRQRAIQNKIAPTEKLITIHNGLDLDNINFLPREQAQKKLLGQTANLVIGTIAEWTHNKGLFYLLEAVQQIKEHQFTLVLIGSGENPDKEQIYEFIKKKRLTNVCLCEYIENAAVYLKAFDIFILPSLKEGLPYTILEAIAAQVPIIATKVGGVPEMVSSTEVLVAPKNGQQLAEKINYFLNHPERAKTIAQDNLQKLKKEFTLQKMLRSYLKGTTLKERP